MQPQYPTKSETIRAAATDWFLRLREEHQSADLVLEWQQWLAQDDAHRREFSELEGLWDTLGRVEPLVPSVSKERRRGWIAAVAAVAALALFGFAYLWQWQSTRFMVLPASAAVETRIAEDRSYDLSDGSRLKVGARSSVVVDFSERLRNVVIDSGEAYFDVAHNPSRPFVVRAGRGTITAVGTAFRVRHLGGRVTVTVVSGTVSVDDSAPTDTIPTSSSLDRDVAARSARSASPTLVHAGEGVVYGGSQQSAQRIDPAVIDALTAGHLKYVREPLQFVVPDVQRYTDLRILVAEPAVGELLYTGTVFPDAIEDWLHILSDAFPIDVIRVDRSTVLLRMRPDQVPPDSR